MLVVCNWKSYVETREKAKKLFATAKRLLTVKRVKIVLAPSWPHLGLLAPTNRSRIMFAAQDVSDTLGGAATAEVSGGTLKNIGASYVIVGHSEQRARGESEALIVEKVKRALANDLTPVLCVGEKERDAEAHYLSGLKQQITSVFTPLTPKERMRMVVAYEPVWAIGKDADHAITEPDLAEMVLYIRKVIGEFEPTKKVKTTILYGGSVEPGNIRSLAGGTGVDGFLVGHASADPVVFSALVKALA